MISKLTCRTEKQDNTLYEEEMYNSKHASNNWAMNKLRQQTNILCFVS